MYLDPVTSFKRLGRIREGKPKFITCGSSIQGFTSGFAMALGVRIYRG